MKLALKSICTSDSIHVPPPHPNPHVVLGIEPGTLSMLSKHSTTVTTELHARPNSFLFSQQGPRPTSHALTALSPRLLELYSSGVEAKISQVEGLKIPWLQHPCSAVSVGRVSSCPSSWTEALPRYFWPSRHFYKVM